MVKIKEVYGNLWTYNLVPLGTVYTITTNGYVKLSGEAVMGAGCAKEAAERWPDFPRRLGGRIQKHGNHVFYRHRDTERLRPDILTFPVKKYWRDRADMGLIMQSANELVAVATALGAPAVLLPRPGCGNGGLDWENRVKPVLSRILDDRFYVITWSRGVKMTYGDSTDGRSRG